MIIYECKIWNILSNETYHFILAGKVPYIRRFLVLLDIIYPIQIHQK